MGRYRRRCQVRFALLVDRLLRWGPTPGRHPGGCGTAHLQGARNGSAPAGGPRVTRSGPQPHPPTAGRPRSRPIQGRPWGWSAWWPAGRSRIGGRNEPAQPAHPPAATQVGEPGGCGWPNASPHSPGAGGSGAATVEAAPPARRSTGSLRWIPRRSVSRVPPAGSGVDSTAAGRPGPPRGAVGPPGSTRPVWRAGQLSPIR